MKFLSSLLTVASMMTYSSCSFANPVIYPYKAPTGLALTSTQPDSHGNFPIYGGASRATNWAVGQWDIPSDLPAGSTPAGSPAGTAWQTSNSYGSIRTQKYFDGSLNMAFSQDGTLLPCTTTSGGVNEFDMLAAPIPPRSAPYTTGNNTTLYPTYASKPSLAEMASFSTSGTYQLVSGGPTPGTTACDINMGAAGVDLILVDLAVSPAQVLWYNLHFSYVCPPEGRQYVFCSASQTRPWRGWTQKGTLNANGTVATYSVGEPITSYGFTPINDHATHAITLNFLQPLLQTIAAGQPYGLDQDASHWKISGYNFGQAIWGGTTMATQFQGFVPQITLNAPQ